MKKLLFSGILAITLLSSSASALISIEDLPSKGVYYTGWGQTTKTAQKFIEKAQDATYSGGGINLLQLAFLRWDGFGNIKDDGALIYSNDPYWKSNAYKELRKIYTATTNGTIAGRNIKFIVSFGGYSYAGMWDILLEDGLRENLAKNLVALMGNKIGKFWDGYKNLAGINIDGIEFDFERSIRITPELNDALVLLVKRMRELQNDKTFLNTIGVSSNSVKNDMIILTTYHTGVDPTNCSTDTNLGPSDGCSYVNDKRSIHSGEVTRLFENIKNKNLFDLYNIMEYDAGHAKDFHPEVSIDNYLKYVPANRLHAGISIKSQWSQDGKFTQTRSKNAGFIKLFKSKNLHGFFTWSIGGVPNSPTADIDKHYYLANVWENITQDSAYYTPASFQATGAKTKIKTISIPGRDHSVVSRDGKTYVVIGHTWYDTSTSEEYNSVTIHTTVYSSYKDYPDFYKRDVYFYACKDRTENLDVSSMIENRKRVVIITSDHNWCKNITIPEPSGKMRGKAINVYRTSGWDTKVNGKSIQRGKFTSYTYR